MDIFRFRTDYLTGEIVPRNDLDIKGFQLTLIDAYDGAIIADRSMDSLFFIRATLEEISDIISYHEMRLNGDFGDNMKFEDSYANRCFMPSNVNWVEINRDGTVKYVI